MDPEVEKCKQYTESYRVREGSQWAQKSRQADSVFCPRSRLFLEAIEGRRLKLGDTHPYTLNSWQTLIELYEAWGKPEKAEKWRAKLLQTEAANQ